MSILRLTRALQVLALAAGLTACGDDPVDETPDSGTPDTGVETDAGDQACARPTGTAESPIGTSLNRTMRSFTLNRCDGTAFDIYGEAEGFCDSSFTVITLAAGWCVPCQMEAELLQANIADAYEAEGVRVVQIMLQNPDYTAATPEFCQQWVDTYDLRFPELLDPEGASWIYAPDNALPATVVIDDRGVIRYREYGTTANLSSLTSALDQLLGR